MSDASKAVFLSYASQDTEAAKKICDALRAAGVEVWFDQSELVGGDAWDQKIKKQIRECALFMPIISPATNARAEGYFRREWKQAVERTHDMADDVPFLFPIVIDDVTDATARVPDKFREVQWTRLKLEETPTGLAVRIASLLAGNAPEDRGQRTEDRKARRTGARWSWRMVFPICGMIIGLMYAARPFWRSMQGPPPKPPAPAGATAPAVSEARRLAERARAMSLQKYDSAAADYAAAEGLIQKALELDPNDAEIWAISSLFHTSIRTRGFDHSPGRRQQARAAAERATKLAPDAVLPLFALGRAQRDSDSAAAEATFKRILELQPDHAEAMSQLAYIYDVDNRYDEAAALYERVLALDPKNAPLTQYLRYLLGFHYRRFAEAEAAIKQSVALAPSANSVAGEAMVALTWHGDAEAAARALAAAPAELRSETRLIWVGALVHLARRDPAETLRTLERTEADYIQDNWFAGPKGMFAGLAHRMAGRHEAARVAWESALAVVDSRLKTSPDIGALHLARGQLLAWLARPDEARREARTLEEFGPGQYGATWIFSPVLIYAALGDAGAAVPVLEKLSTSDRTRNEGWPLTVALLRTDVRWDPLRDDPRFQKLLAEAEAAEIAALPPRDWPKSPELKRAIGLLDGLQAIPEDFRLAEEIVQPALEKSPTDPETLAAMARVQSMWLLRGWDRSPSRYQKAKVVCERALQLAPDEPEALQAMAIYLYARAVENQRALDLAQRAVDLAPQEPRFHRQRDNCLFVLSLTATGVLTDLAMQQKNAALERALVSARHTTTLFPRDPLVHYELARHYRDLGRWAEFEQETDAALALAPVANAMVWKARARLGLHDDLAGMKALLDQVPDRVRSIERTVFAYFLYSAYTGNTREGLDALDGMTESWMIDFDFRGPKALPKAVLLEIDGKKELARLQYQAALPELLRARAANPADVQTYLVEAWIQHGLGNEEAARAALQVYNESIVRPYTVSPMAGWWFHAVAANLLMGNRQTALELMRDAVTSQAEGRAALRARLAMDRRMAPFRDDPEIKALLAEPGDQRTGDRGQETAKQPEAKP